MTALPDLGLVFSRAKLYCRAVSSLSVVLPQARGDGHPWESYRGVGEPGCQAPVLVYVLFAL